MYKRALRVPEIPMLMVTLMASVAYWYHPEFTAYVFVLLFIPFTIFPGIAHGALDNYLVLNSLDSTKRKISFYLIYILVMIMVLLVWMMHPAAGLSLFLILSVWHFGETDSRRYGIDSTAQHLINGFLLLSIILFSHFEETLHYISLLNVELTLSANSWNHILSYALILVLGLNLWYRAKAKEGILAFVMFLLFITLLPLIPAFGFYFLGIHSFTGWSDIKRTTQMTNVQMFRKAVLFTIPAVLFIVGYILSGREHSQSEQQYIAWFFIALSALSSPHIFVMHYFYKEKYGKGS